MTTVRILDRTAAAMAIWNAICAATPDGDISRFNIAPKGEDTTAEAVLTVNGVEAPVIEALADFVAMYEDHVATEASKIALNMVMGAGLQGLLTALQHQEFELKQALSKAFPAFDWSVE